MADQSGMICVYTRANARPGVRHQRCLGARAFSLLELLVVVAIIALLVSILTPSLSAARRHARGVQCLANLHMLGHGIEIYASDNNDILPPSRLPRLNDCETYADIRGGRKYRPTFIAIMSIAVNATPFDDPKTCRNEIDRYGEPGDQQNYASKLFFCPEVPEWTDERNASYGYNYQFLGNTRLRNVSDPLSFKHWPIRIHSIRNAGTTVAAADCMGTAASSPPAERRPYVNNVRDDRHLGNEGFNLDPPRVDPVNGEMADFDGSPQARSAADPRHAKRASVLWVDGHADARSSAQLGYQLEPDGRVSFIGDNARWTGTGYDVAWTLDYRPE